MSRVLKFRCTASCRQPNSQPIYRHAMTSLPRALRLILALFLLSIPLAASAGESDGSYGFPFTNPYEATVIGTPTEYMGKLPARIPVEKEYLKFPSQHIPGAFWYNDRMYYSMALQDDPAPLVFVIAGTGAAHNAGKMDMLMRALYGAGFHVVNLSSPTHANFLVPASSTQVPGFMPDDCEDLYRVMRRIRDEVLPRELITGYCLTGYSLGGAHSAVIARMDEERREFGFRRVLLINPPVNLYTSTQLLDSYLTSEDQAEGAFHRLVDHFSSFYKQTEHVDFTDDFLYQVYRNENISVDDLKAAIGISFRLSSANMIFSSDACTRAGYIIPPDHVLSATEYYEPYFMASVKITFEEYFDEYLLPFLKHRDPSMTRDKAIRLCGLRRMADWLRAADHVGMITNEDELILTHEDIDFLRTTFGDRAFIFPLGGHCGNMAYRDNLELLTRWLGKGVLQ